jgi:2-keto-4-pentenoate hydratase
MAAQLERWRKRLDDGERRLGWKIALNVSAIQEALNITAPVIGALSSGPSLPPGSSHSLAGATRAGVEPEVAVHMSRDLRGGSGEAQARQAIGALGPAIEIVDIDRPFEDLEAILAANVFHRSVMLGPSDSRRAGGAADDVAARVSVNGAERATTPAGAVGDLAATVLLVADLLAELGETLLAGDVVIAGSLTPIVWVEPGDRVEVELSGLGPLLLEIAPA